MFGEAQATNTIPDQAPDAYWYTRAFAAMSDGETYPDAEALNKLLNRAFAGLVHNDEVRELDYAMSVLKTGEEYVPLPLRESAVQGPVAADSAASADDRLYDTLPEILATAEYVPADHGPVAPFVPEVIAPLPVAEAASIKDEQMAFKAQQDEALVEAIPARREIVFDDGYVERRGLRRSRILGVVAGLGLTATTLGSGVFINDGYSALTMQAPHTSSALVDVIPHAFAASEFLAGSVGVPASAGMAAWIAVHEWRKGRSARQLETDAVQVTPEKTAPKHRAPRLARTRALFKKVFQMPQDNIEYTDVALKLFSGSH